MKSEKLLQIIESTNIILQISHKFANPRIVAKSKKLFCKSEKIFCLVLLAPAVCHHQRFSRHFAASKMEEFCLSCGSKVNPGDKFCFKCGAKVAEISHPTARVSTPEDQRASSSSSTKSLSQYLASKAEERREANNKAG